MNDTTEHQHDAQIDRYLKARMSADEKAQFEIRMLEEPELLERVQLLESLQLELGAEEEFLLAGDGAVTSATVLPFRSWMRQPLSLAASVLVASLGVNALLNSTQRSNVPEVMPVGALVLLDTRRDTAVPAFNGVAPYLLQIDAGIGTQVNSMSLTLRDASGTVLLQRGVNVDTDGWVRLLYTQPLNGEYQIVLEWTDGVGASQALNYPFNVQSP